MSKINGATDSASLCFKISPKNNIFVTHHRKTGRKFGTSLKNVVIPLHQKTAGVMSGKQIIAIIGGELLIVGLIESQRVFKCAYLNENLRTMRGYVTISPLHYDF